MKKLMLTLAVALIAMTATAQTKFFAGGSLGYSTTSHDGATKATSFKLLPEFGYVLNQNMAVGLEIGYDAKTTYHSENYKETDGSFVFSPYFRYTFFHFGNVSLFGDAKFTYKMTNDHTNNQGTTHDDKGSLFGLYIQPGIAYSLNENFSLVAKLGEAIGFESSKKNFSGARADNTFLLLNLNNAISFGCYYNF